MAVVTRVFPKTDTPFPLGRHVAHDDRSRAFAVPEIPAASAPQKSVTWANVDPVLNQMKTSGCVGNAAAQFLNCQIYTKALQAKGKQWLTEDDALAIYSKATHEDGISAEFYPPHDDGSTALACAKALQDLGWIDRYFHAFTWNQFLTAIQTQPVMLGTAWTRSMFTPDSNYYVNPGPLNDFTILGGHEYLCRGIDFPTQTVLCRNSWGQNWPGSKNGEFLLHFRDLQALLRAQGDVLIPHVAGTP